MAEGTCRRCDMLARLAVLNEQRAVTVAELNRLWAEEASAKRDIALIDRRIAAIAAEPYHVESAVPAAA